MKSTFLLAATALLTPALLSAAPLIAINQQSTSVSATAGQPDTFTEGTLVPFDHSVFSAFDSTSGYIYSATVEGRLLIELFGLHLSGSSHGTVDVEGDSPPANAAAYGSVFDFRIVIPLEDAPYAFTFAGGSSASANSSASVRFYEEGLSATPLAFYGSANTGAPVDAASISGVFEPGKTYILTGGDNAYHSQDASKESSSYSFDLQIVPEPSALSLLGIVAAIAFAPRRRR